MYDIFIRFQCAPRTVDELKEIYEFTGDGRRWPYDITHGKWATWEEYRRAKELGNSEEYQIRYGHPGVVIPLHITLQKMTASGKQVILDSIFYTAGISRNPIEIQGLHRKVSTIELDKGIYDITAVTVQKSVLPSMITHSFLEMLNPTDVPDIRRYPSEDNE